MGLILAACDASTPVAPTDAPVLAVGGEPTPRLLASWVLHASGGSNPAPPGDPVGLVFCLIHDPELSFDNDLSVPYPDRVLSDAVIGCDQVILGSGQTIDYTPDNAPKFAEFAARMTNGTDEIVFSWADAADNSLHRVNVGGAGGVPESWIVLQGKGKYKRPSNDVPINFRSPRPDLVGNVLDFIRLTVVDARLWMVDGRLRYSYDLIWGFYGRNANAP
jgi:hypothetical protein